jgi:hypothetical protein
LGDLWLYTNKSAGTETVYVLVSLQGSSTSKGQLAKWMQLGAGGGGILTLTGDAGGLGPVSGDIVRNINIVGDGGITTTVTGDPATHTLTVTALGGMGTDDFKTDSGTATQVGSNINIIGAAGSGITTSGVGDTVTINALGVASQFMGNSTGPALPLNGVLNVFGAEGCSVDAAGDTLTINAGVPFIPLKMTTEGGIATETAYNINIQGLTRPITGVKNIVTDRVLTNTITLDLTADVVVDNTLTISAIGAGVVMSSGAGLLSSTDSGTPGEVMMTGSGVPDWGTFTSSDGSIVIDTSHDYEIDLKAVGITSGSGAFSAYQPNTVTACFYGNPIDTYVFGTQDALVEDFDDLSAFYPGNGVGASCTYTAPTTAKYYFQIDAAVETNAPGSFLYPIILNIIVGGVATNKNETRPYGTGPTTIITTSHAAIVALTAGQIVTFQITSTYPAASAPNGNVVGNAIDKWTRISGFRIGSGGTSTEITFNTNDGNSSTSVGQQININGGDNIHTESIPNAGQNVIISLDDNVLIPVGGSLAIDGFTEGVMQTTNTGLVTSNKGTDGQVLIGATGLAPAWANLTAGSGINIFNGNNSCTISSTGGTGTGAFRAYTGGWELALTAPSSYYLLGTKVAYNMIDGDSTGFFPGDPATSTPANYTASSTGFYFFNIMLPFSSQYDVSNYFKNIIASVVKAGSPLFFYSPYIRANLYPLLWHPGPGTEYSVFLELTSMIYLNAGDIVEFEVKTSTTTSSNPVWLEQGTMISIFKIS